MNCATPCILKTRQTHHEDGSSTLHVTAYGYRAKPRLIHISVSGGDGREHDVPVHWEEYIPVKGQGKIMMKEDHLQMPTDTTYAQHIEHINQVLSNTGFNHYRRHIASSLL